MGLSLLLCCLENVRLFGLVLMRGILDVEKFGGSIAAGEQLRRTLFALRRWKDRLDLDIMHMLLIRETFRHMSGERPYAVPLHVHLRIAKHLAYSLIPSWLPPAKPCFVAPSCQSSRHTDCDIRS